MAHVTALPRGDTPPPRATTDAARERTWWTNFVLHGLVRDTGDEFGCITRAGWTGSQWIWKTTVRLDLDHGTAHVRHDRAREIATALGRALRDRGIEVYSVYVERVRTQDGTWPEAIFVYSDDPAELPRGGATTGRVAL